MADGALVDLAWICVRSLSSNHAETLSPVSIVSSKVFEVHYLLESSGLAAGDVVNIKTTLVDQSPLGTAVADLRDTDVASVLVVEEHDCCPVVRKVLLECARCASGQSCEVVLDWVHGDVEGVSSNDLVKMRRVQHTRIDDWVGTLDNELRTREPEHVLSSRILRKQSDGGECGPLHLDLW